MAGLFFLSSCVAYVKESKHEQKVDFSALQKISDTDQTGAFFLSLMDINSLTREIIIDRFGTPEKIEEENGKSVLHYSFSGKPPYSEIWFVIPFTYNNDDDVYGYSFTFESGRLSEISYEELRRKIRGVIIFPPVLLNKDMVLDVNPFETKECREEFSKIRGDFPHMDTATAAFGRTCRSNRLFNIGVANNSAMDKSRWQQGYSKVSSIKIFVYDGKSLPVLKEELVGYYQKSFENTDKNRFKHPVFSQKDYKTDHLDCRIFSKTGKDFQAPNKGSNEYLIFDYAGAFCFTNNPEMVALVENSNRYPRSMKAYVDTYRELTGMIDTVSIAQTAPGKSSDKKQK